MTHNAPRPEHGTAFGFALRDSAHLGFYYLLPTAAYVRVASRKGEGHVNVLKPESSAVAHGEMAIRPRGASRCSIRERKRM